MKVLHVAWAYPSMSDESTGSFFRNQVTALIRRGIDVRVAVPAPYVPAALKGVRSRWRYRADLGREWTYEGVSARHLWYLRLPGPDYLWVWSMEREIGRAISRDQPDVVHAHGAFPLGLTVARACARMRIPCVVTLHGGDTNVLPFRAPRYAEMFREMTSLADAVVAVSSELADVARTLSGRHPATIPIGIDLEIFRQRPSQEDGACRAAVTKGGRQLLYVGNLIESKGIRELTDALPLLADLGCECLVAGAGPLESMIRNSPYCRHLGRLPNKVIAETMMSCAALVLPSHTEGLPTVVVEAGAIKLPVVATPVGALESMLSDGRGFLAPIGNPRKLSEVIREVLTNPTEAARRAERLREYVLNNLDADHCADRLVELYARVLTSHTNRCSTNDDHLTE